MTTQDDRPSRSPMMTVVAVVALAMLMLLVNRSSEPASPAPSAAVAAPAPAPGPASPAPVPAVPAPAEAAPVHYSGGTRDGSVAVAVTMWAGRAEGHLAGMAVPIVGWLEGPVDGGTVALTGPNGARLTGTVAGDRLTGTVWTGPGPGAPFTAAVDERPGGPR